MLDSHFWKNYFKVYDILNIVIPYQELMRELLYNLNVKKNDLILDAGSGTGNLAILIKRRGGNVICIDSIEECLEIYKQKDPNAVVYKCDLTTKLPFPDNFFDKIVSNNVLYLIHPDKRGFVLKEFYRVLKPGGKIVLSNLRAGWKPIKIYLAHLSKEYEKNGLIKLVMKMTQMFVPTVKMFYYNAKIIREGNQGDFKFMKEGEQRILLQKYGFKDISKDKYVYADQAVLNFGFK